MTSRFDNRFTPPSRMGSVSASSDSLTSENSSVLISSKKNVSVNDLYKRTEVIGRGKFGVVYKGYNRITNQVVAIKVLNLDTDQEEVKDVQQEVLFLSQLKQAPNIIHYHGSFLNDTKLWIVMDNCAGGSVRSLLKPGRIEEKYIGVIVRELLIALQYVHKAGVIHRDLKAANVLITKEGNVKLCDFGVAAQLTSNALKRTTMAGTPYWMAPEVIMEGARYDMKVDIWSLGITIFEIATGNPPYSDKDAMRAMQLITKSKPPRLEGRNHSSLLKEMIALCLDENPEERSSADDLLKSRFIKAHKNTPNSILKEIISRYLLWREKKSSRDSMALYGMDEELDNNGNPQNTSNGEMKPEDLDVNWDFNSLSSSEYIIENDINVNQITNQPDYGDELYNDDEYFLTTNQQTYMTGNENNHTSREDPTLRASSTTAGHTMGTRKEAPKSLLQLFEEDEASEMKQTKLSENKYDSVPKLPTMASSNIPRSSSPIIEIPNMEDIQVSELQLKPRSRAPTLSHTQSAAAVLARGPLTELGDLPQRRPTISQSQSPVSAPPTGQSNYPLPPASLSQSTSNLSQQSGRTPSPKRSTNTSSTTVTDNVNLSPQRISGMTPSHTMKPLSSSSNMSALLQPINKVNNSEQANDSAAALQASSPTPLPASKPRSKNITNLHLKMPAPTSASPSLQALTNFEQQQQHQHQQQQHQHQQLQNGHRPSVSSATSPASRVNQFGFDASHALSMPLSMTPLNEKSQLSAMNSFLHGGKITPTGSGAGGAGAGGGSITPPRSKNSSTTVVGSLQSSGNGSVKFFISKDEEKKMVFPKLPEVNGLLFLDTTPDAKQKLLNEISDLSRKFVSLLDILEEDFNVYIE